MHNDQLKLFPADFGSTFSTFIEHNASYFTFYQKREVLIMLVKCLLGVSLLSIVSLAPISNVENLEQSQMSETKAICYKAALKEGISDPINEVYELKDLSGNTFYAQIGDEDGFMVFDPVVINFIEKSNELESPYDFSGNHDYYYFGPMNYYERIGDDFYSILDETYVDLEYVSALQDIFDEQLVTFRSAQLSEDIKDYTNKNFGTILLVSISKLRRVYTH